MILESNKKTKGKIPFKIFLSIFLAFAAFTTMQMMILGDYINYTEIPIRNMAGIVGFWLILAMGFTFLTIYQIEKYYEKPVIKLADAIKKVANGDFSVYVKPIHTQEKYDYLDEMILDFNKMVEDLGSIETLKTDFFSNVSHEIKTPLSIIQNYSELLFDSKLDSKLRNEYILAMHQATLRLSGLITNMLKINKLEKQTIQVLTEPYDVCAQLCECRVGFEKMWEKKNITFEADIEDKVMIDADESLLEIVWNNLLSNAIKFTDEGGIIMIRQTLELHRVIVQISDTGCGMNENTRKRIFDKFYQGDTSHAKEGNGLGLALVKRVLELMNGSIEVNSEAGKGSTFTVSIPRQNGNEEINREEGRIL